MREQAVKKKHVALLGGDSRELLAVFDMRAKPVCDRRIEAFGVVVQVSCKSCIG